MFTEQSFAIYVLDDDSVHLMSEIRQALFKICSRYYYCYYHYYYHYHQIRILLFTISLRACFPIKNIDKYLQVHVMKTKSKQE